MPGRGVALIVVHGVSDGVAEVDVVRTGGDDEAPKVDVETGGTSVVLLLPDDVPNKGRAVKLAMTAAKPLSTTYSGSIAYTPKNLEVGSLRARSRLKPSFIILADFPV